MTAANEEPRKNGFRVSKVTIALAICCVIAVGVGGYFFIKYQETQHSEASQNAKIVEKVAKSIQLPDEAPVLVTVADKAKLTNKQLASKVEDEDIMIIFAKAKRLIVYRPSIEKVADVLSFSATDELPKKK